MTERPNRSVLLPERHTISPETFEKQPLAQAEDRLSRVEIHDEDGLIVTYFLDPQTDQLYGLSDAGDLYLDHEKVEVRTAADIKLLARAKALKAREHLIHELRQIKAERLSEGDPILANILQLHIERMDGKDPYPSRKNGIDLYVVGENATYSFYLGTKEGRIYRYSVSDVPNLKDVALRTLGVDEIDPETLTDAQIAHIAEEFAQELVYYLESPELSLREEADATEANEATEAVARPLTFSESVRQIPFPASETPDADWEEYADKMKENQTIWVQRWAPALRPLVKRAFGPEVNAIIDVSLEGIDPVRIELSNDPIDVTDSETMYLGRTGFLKPTELRQSSESVIEDES